MCKGEGRSSIDASSVKALVFDLGGVLIDIDFRRITDAWSDAWGCDRDALAAKFSHDAAYEAHERGEIDASGYFATLREGLGVALSDEELLRGWNALFGDPVKGMADRLRAASMRYRVFVFTNSNPSHQAVWSKTLGRELEHVDAVFVSSTLGLRKPDVEAFELVAERAGFRPEELLFFDDTEENVEGARRALMQAVLVRDLKDIDKAFGELRIGHC